MTRVQTASDDAIKQLRKATTHSEIIEGLARLGAMIGCHNFIMIPAPNCPLDSKSSHKADNKDNIISFGNYPRDIMEYYATEQSALFDPCRNIAITNTGIILWRKVFQEARGRNEREFITKMRENGLRDGISLPIYGSDGCMAILNYASGQFLDFHDGDGEILLFVAITAYQRIKQYMAKSILKQSLNVKLSNREIECLQWAMEGKSNWEIGVLMGISARTVQFHMANCQNKLGVSNRMQAAMKALIHNIARPRNEASNIWHLETKSANEPFLYDYSPNK